VNFSEFCDPAIDREIARAQALQTTDPDAASRLWAKVDRDVTEKAPIVAYANAVVLEVKSARVRNYQYNPQWGTLLNQLWVR
jgi:peptide/nickel transport system substrate-binding protein